MFSDCSSLNNLPDIAKRDTKNVESMSSMFYGCIPLNNLPNFYLSKYFFVIFEEDVFGLFSY